ncbi:hypothetical protein SJI00_21145 [Pseudomonas sp. RP23018S]|uniref:hypothetical protein n=1 Tax=Pseudomonas sp. RP23018S TaxID=3096037 RepID=UPI002ACAF2C1|nr:hypothetical protein [Pseudomonas sp. RP23018S]MDZ5605284.1 hypothetical protein [Pseudomonas sp. RP23018S]
MSKHNFSVKCARICGHFDLISMTYGSKAENTHARLYAANTLCSACVDSLIGIVKPADKGFFKLDLPPLRGTPRAVSYANSIRIQRLRYVGPIMAKLQKMDDPFAQISLAIFKMMFKISSSSFWINGKDFSNDWNWMSFEIAALMRKTRTSALNPMPNSAHAYWLATDQAVIADAANALQLLPPAQGHIEPAVPAVEAHCAVN